MSGSLTTNEKGEGTQSLEVRYLSLLEYLPELCRETKAKLLGMKSKVKTQDLDSKLGSGPESLHSLTVGGDGSVFLSGDCSWWPALTPIT